MSRLRLVPLTLAVLVGCQGRVQTAAPTSASIDPVLMTDMVVGEVPSQATIDDPPEVLDPQTPADAQGAGGQESSDPPGWIAVEEVAGKPVETERRYFASGRMRRILTRMKGTEGPFGHHGRDLSLHENGAWKQEAFWDQGKMSGSYKEWFQGGQLKLETEFAAGKRDGLYKEYGERGVLRTQGQYSGGLLNGEFLLWFGTGDPQEVSHWVHGEKTGRHRIWDRDRTPITNDTFERGLRHGLGLVYHRIPGEELVHQSGQYVSGQKQGAWVEWNQAGEKVREQEYVDSKRSGFFREWRKGVKTLETQYKDNVENGHRLEFFADGKPFSRGTMKNGARDGAWTYWEQDGSIQAAWSGLYKDGKKVQDLPKGTEGVDHE